MNKPAPLSSGAVDTSVQPQDAGRAMAAIAMVAAILCGCPGSEPTVSNQDGAGGTAGSPISSGGRPATGGQPVAGGGGGGGGGDPQKPQRHPDAAADWTEHFPIVYSFDSGSAKNDGYLGALADLTATENVFIHEAASARQGSHFLQLACDQAPCGGALLVAPDASIAATNPEEQQALTYGCWSMLEIEGRSGTSHLFGVKPNTEPPSSGYRLSVDMHSGARGCQIYNGVVGHTPEEVDVWTHSVCRTGDEIHLDGEFANVQNETTMAEPGVAPLQIGGSDFWGRIDECFVYFGILSDVAIRRIYNCGIDGNNCRCNPNDKAAFEACRCDSNDNCQACPDDPINGIGQCDAAEPTLRE